MLNPNNPITPRTSAALASAHGMDVGVRCLILSLILSMFKSINKFILLTAFTFFIHHSANGQRSGGQTGANLKDHLLINDKEAVPRMDIEDVLGSRYENDSFQLSMVETLKDTFYDVPMRYNIFEDVVEFKDNKDRLLLLDPLMTLKKVTINDLVLVVRPYNLDGQIKTGFFVLLSDGKVELLGKKIIKFQPLIPAKALQYENTPAKFLNAPDQYYARIGNNPAVLINKLKKTIALFPDHQKSLLSFVDRRKLGKNKEDLLKLWEYYNSLQDQPK